IVGVRRGGRGAVGIGFLREAVEKVPRVGGGYGGGTGLVGSGGDAGSKVAGVATGIIAVADGSGFGIRFAGKAGHGVIGIGALVRAVLRDIEKIAEGVVAVRGEVAETARVFGDLREAAERVEVGLAFFAGGVGSGDGVVGVRGADNGAVLQGDGRGAA